jgi:hypothetical protein
MTMKKTMFTTGILLLVFSLSLTSCKKDKQNANEEELITTVKLTFTETGTGAVTNYTFKDLDGDGGSAPTLYEDIVLAPSKTYNMALTVSNESVSPAEDITSEISAEGTDHQFYFQPSGANVTVSNLNTDGSGLPLGLTSTWTTGAVSNGTVKITLKHKPGIKASGDAVTKGDTDIELTWVTRVQ